MGLHSKFSGGVDRLIRSAGTQIRIRYFQPTIGSVWDDDLTALPQSGNDLWTSGIVYPVGGLSREGSNESVLMEQGKLIDTDKTLWTNGSLGFTGSVLMIDILVGSGTNNDLYTTIENGGQVWEIQGKAVYHKQWIRLLTAGSLLK